jgi:hypothetical protein
MRRLDATLRLFDGDLLLTEIVHMDLPSQRALIQSRIDNLKESQDNYENGKLDSYSRRYAAVMGGYLHQPPGTIDRTESKNENRGAKNLHAPLDNTEQSNKKS